MLVGVQVDEQVVNFVEHFLGAGVLAVNLVDDHNHGQTGLKGFAQHKTRLRQRPFSRVHQQDRAGSHGERALHFAAKVGVARGVNDIDLDPFPVDGAVLGGNGDAAFAFQIHFVHHAVVNLLVGAEHAALLEQTVHEGGLAVVNVGDNGDVTKGFIVLHGFVPLKNTG